MRILYLMPRKLWETKMSQARENYACAIARQPGVEFVRSGLGWQGYDESKTVMENLGPADAVIAYKAKGLQGLFEYPVRAIQFNEANAHSSVDEIGDAWANLVIHHHQSDMDRWCLPFAWPIEKVHIPHCADGFTVNSNRPIPCLLTGVLADAVYPLRGRLARLVKSGAIPGEIRPHPGYRLQGREECLLQYQSYMTHLGTAKMSLVDSSRWTYPLAKYIESFSMGCLVVGDMPSDPFFRETLGKHLVEISPVMSDAEITEIIQLWLSYPEKLEERARAGQEAARSFSTDYYARQILSHISSVLNGQAAS